MGLIQGLTERIHAASRLSPITIGTHGHRYGSHSGCTSNLPATTVKFPGCFYNLEQYTPRDMLLRNLRAKKSARCSPPMSWHGTSGLGPRLRKPLSETRERRDFVSAVGPDIAHASCTHICSRISITYGTCLLVLCKTNLYPMPISIALIIQTPIRPLRTPLNSD